MSADDAVARHDLIGHAEVAAAVGDELVDFLERAGIEQQVDALARGQLARLALAAQPFFTAAQLGAPIEILKKFLVHEFTGLRILRIYANCSAIRQFVNP